MSLKYKRGNVIFTSLPDPVLKDPNANTHPFLILSPDSANRIEEGNPHYVCVMLSHSGNRSAYCYEIEPIHFERKVKESSFAKLHLIWSIPEDKMTSLANTIEELIVDLICKEIAVRTLGLNI